MAKDLKGGGFGDFASDGTMDIVAYIVIFLGLLFTFFEPTVGGVLVGVVVGIYFADEIMAYMKGAESTYQNLGMTRAIIFGGGLLALIISIPMFFISAGVVGAVTSLIKPKTGATPSNSDAEEADEDDEEE